MRMMSMKTSVSMAQRDRSPSMRKSRRRRVLRLRTRAIDPGA